MDKARTKEPIGIRAYNERLLISEIRQAGALSKVEIARATGLSGQSATVIVNSLLREELLLKCPKVRGRVGKPLTPIALNPEGAYSLGIKIGRRSLEVLLVDFCGSVCASHTVPYLAPFPELTMTLSKTIAKDMISSMDDRLVDRLVGLGVAMPWGLDEWSDVLGLERGAIAAWRQIDVASELESAIGMPVNVYNDATAACAAEMIAGDGISTRSALYLYLGTFAGGGVVINGRLYRGEQLNAGAVGSMPMNHSGKCKPPQQLIHHASVIELERLLEAAGIDLLEILEGSSNSIADKIFGEWLQRAAEPLCRAIVSAVSVVDFETIVVDGILPPQWRSRVVESIKSNYRNFDYTGLSSIGIVAGSIGPQARVLGAALYPLLERFSPDPDMIVRMAGPSASQS